MSTAIAEPPAGIATPPATDEPLYEIVGGERVELPPMGIYANLIAARLFIAVESFLQTHPLGTVVMEALLILDRGSNLRRRPDVSFVAADRWPLEREIPETGDWDVVPTLAIEVLSPHDVSTEVEGKVLEYFAHGVQAVWVVHPEHRRVYCYSAANETRILDEQSTLTGGEVLPALTIPLANLFRRTTNAPQPQRISPRLSRNFTDFQPQTLSASYLSRRVPADSGPVTRGLEEHDTASVIGPAGGHVPRFPGVLGRLRQLLSR